MLKSQMIYFDDIQLEGGLQKRKSLSGLNVNLLDL